MLEIIKTIREEKEIIKRMERRLKKIERYLMGNKKFKRW